MGEDWSALGLVTAYAVVTVVLPVLRSTRRRLIWIAWQAPGKSRLLTVQTLIRRISGARARCRRFAHASGPHGTAGL